AQRTPTNRLLAIYLLVSATALLFSHRPAAWPALLALHLLGAAAALGLGPLGRLGRALNQRFPSAFRIVADWYPIILVPALYTELATLNLSVWNGSYFDAHIQRLDQALFGEQPSTELSRHWPSLTLSEVLHASYLSYYFIIYAPPLILYARQRRAEFRAMVFAVMLSFFVHYLFFIYFPVQGPRYLFPAPDGEISRGKVFGLTHKILEAGSSRGAAFPSSHLGVSLTQTLITFQFLPRLAIVLALLTFGLALGAVYGGFHYATDMIAGLILGVVVVLIAPSARRLLGGAR
ncbi:MAG: phosphatase PAP2 family protein, partial [Longimicrobiales bacterium]